MPINPSEDAGVSRIETAAVEVVVRLAIRRVCVGVPIGQAGLPTVLHVSNERTFHQPAGIPLVVSRLRMRADRPGVRLLSAGVRVDGELRPLNAPSGMGMVVDDMGLIWRFPPVRVKPQDGLTVTVSNDWGSSLMVRELSWWGVAPREG